MARRLSSALQRLLLAALVAAAFALAAWLPSREDIGRAVERLAPDPPRAVTPDHLEPATISAKLRAQGWELDAKAGRWTKASRPASTATRGDARASD